VELHNTVFARSGPISAHKLFTSCIQRHLVLRSCDWVMSALSAALHIFSFQRSLLFPYIGPQAAPALRCVIGFNTQYQTSDFAENLGRYVSFTEPTVQGKDFELILTIKMETRHPVEGQFGSKFPAICNHCRVMVAWNRKTWKFCEKFLRFLKTIPYDQVFTASSIDVVAYLCKMCPTENRWNHVLFKWQKNTISAASQTVATVRIAPIIC